MIGASTSKTREAAFAAIRATEAPFTVRGIAIALAQAHTGRNHYEWMGVVRRAIALLVDVGMVTRLREGGGGRKALYVYSP